jgi:hypothetical protein
MRAFPLLAIGCLFKTIDAHSEHGPIPLVSVSKVTDFVMTSVYLTVDAVKFTSSKIEDTLPGEAQMQYKKFTMHCSEYLKMVQTWWATNAIVGMLRTTTLMIFGKLTAIYERADTNSARIIDPVVAEFEARYPSSSGVIGKSLLDRLLLIYWLDWFIRFVARCIFRSSGVKKAKF